MTCKYIHCENLLSGRQRSFCSINCKNKHYVSLNRRNNKASLVAELGGQCVDCGYQGPPFMFDFDHRNPEDKSFGLAHSGISHSLEKMRIEAQKCDLVCANCHRWRTHRQRCSGCDYCIIP